MINKYEIKTEYMRLLYSRITKSLPEQIFVMRDNYPVKYICSAKASIYISIDNNQIMLWSMRARKCEQFDLADPDNIDKIIKRLKEIYREKS